METKGGYSTSINVQRDEPVVFPYRGILHDLRGDHLSVVLIKSRFLFGADSPRTTLCFSRAERRQIWPPSRVTARVLICAKSKQSSCPTTYSCNSHPIASRHPMRGHDRPSFRFHFGPRPVWSIVSTIVILHFCLTQPTAASAPNSPNWGYSQAPYPSLKGRYLGR